MRWNRWLVFSVTSAIALYAEQLGDISRQLSTYPGFSVRMECS
jgi:hypothetical protein